jgi:hypothetical protein
MRSRIFFKYPLTLNHLKIEHDILITQELTSVLILFSVIFNLFSVIFNLFSVIFNLFSVIFNLFSVIFNLFSVIFNLFSVISFWRIVDLLYWNENILAYISVTETLELY